MRELLSTAFLFLLGAAARVHFDFKDSDILLLLAGDCKLSSGISIEIRTAGAVSDGKARRLLDLLPSSPLS
jgi:hypothetical protein